MVRSRIRPRALAAIAGAVAVAAAVVLPSLPVHAATRATRWNGAAGNNLWGDPLNWDGGVLPDADTDVWASHATIDLGGATRAVASFNDGGGLESTTRIVNGTLRTPLVNGGGQINIASNVTAPSGATLQLLGSVNVPGRIVGPIDVVFGTNTEITTTQTYTGNTFVNGWLTLSGVSGRLTSSPVVEVQQVLNLVNPSGLANSEVRLAGGTLNAWSQETTVADLSLAPGRSLIDVGINPLHADSLHRSPGATLTLSAGTVGTNRGGLELNTLPAMTGDNASPTRRAVVPWAHYYGTFVGRDDDGALRPLNTATEYATSLADGQNVRLTAPATAAASVAPNSLVVVGTGLTVAAGAKLTVASGGVILYPAFVGTGDGRIPSAITGNGTLDLGAEGIVYAWRNLSDNRPVVIHTLDVPITAGSLLKGGDGDLALNRANTLPGGITIGQGRILANAPGSLGAGPITFAGGSLTVNTADATFENALRLDIAASVAVPAAGTTTFAGAVTGDSSIFFGDGGIVSRGGTVRLAPGAAGENDSGRFTIDAGDLAGIIVDRTLASRDAILYATAGSAAGPFIPLQFHGTGAFLGQVYHGKALVSPGPVGNAPGRFTEGRATFNDSTLHIDLAGPIAGTDYDQLVVLDSLFLSTNPVNDNVLDVLLAPGFTPALGDVFTIIDNRFAGPVDGYFAASNLPEGAFFAAGGTTFRISYTGGDGNDVTLTSVVPEPASITLLAACGFALPRRKRKLPG